MTLQKNIVSRIARDSLIWIIDFMIKSLKVLDFTDLANIVWSSRIFVWSSENPHGVQEEKICKLMLLVNGVMF